jgi:hypothetical protein
MRESRTSGSVEGVPSNEHPYSDCSSAHDVANMSASSLWVGHWTR